jgi:TolB-like protein
MSATSSYRFLDFTLQPDEHALLRGGERIMLEPRPMLLLKLLVERGGELLTRDAVVAHLWGDAAELDVDMAINSAVRKVRRALGDHGALIETVKGHGYRFTAAVEQYGAAREMRTTIAVLPLLNLTGAPDREYLADSLTEELITILAQLDPHALAVVGHTASMAYKRAALPLADVARALGAKLILEGAVRTRGEVLRVTLRLLEPDTHTQTWSHAFDHHPASLVALRELLATALSTHLQQPIARPPALPPRQTSDPDAYDLYLRGRHYWYQLTPDSTKRAVELYSLATERDPSYALAWAGQADAHASSAITSDVPSAIAREVAGAALARAQAAQSELAEVHVSAGFVDLFLEWRWRRAADAFDAAVARDPSNALAHRMAGVVASHLREHATARASLAVARRLDPYAMHHSLSAMIELHAGDPGAAIVFARQATVISPQFWIGHYQLAQALVQAGQLDAALDALHAAGQTNGANSKVIGLRGYALARSGRTEAAQQIVAALLGIARERYVPPYARALVHLGLGDIDQCIAALEQALAVRDVHLIFLPCDPKWRALDAEPRFADLLRRCAFDACRELA